MTKDIDRRQFGLGLAAGTIALAAGAPARAAGPLKIRVGWVVAPSSLAPLIEAKRDILKHVGKSYEMEALHFEGTPLLITGLASGELDIGGMAFSAFGLAIQNAQMTDLRIISDESEDGVAGFATNEFMVLKDSPIQSIADLKGKVLATNTVGSAVDIGMRALLKKNGLEAKRDYTIIETPFPTMKSMLSSKKADLVSAVPPFSLDPDLRAMSRTLFTQRDAFGVSILGTWVAHKAFIEANRPQLVDFLEDVIRVIRWYKDPKNHDEAVGLLSKIIHQPPERLQWAFTGQDQTRDPNGMPNLGAIQSNLNDMKAVGQLNIDIDVSKFADTSLVQEAAQRLG